MSKRTGSYAKAIEYMKSHPEGVTANQLVDGIGVQRHAPDFITALKAHMERNGIALYISGPTGSGAIKHYTLEAREGFERYVRRPVLPRVGYGCSVTTSHSMELSACSLRM